MTELLGRMYSWIAFIPKMTLTNILEILLISFLIYEVLLWVQNTRAWVLLKGGLFIVGFYLLATIFRFNTITWLISHAGQLALIALLICAANFAIGHWVGEKNYKREASQSLGQKNTTLTIYLALVYAGPLVAMGVISYVLWHNSYNAIQFFFHDRKKNKA